ncbi:MAG: hypothetical protein BWY05_00803 [Euryarchaeota archaeon ADurb.Bin165]|jgi:hypothetical protein|nr:MAG: hypothetical protein BWY05_00803 [Euryarchaeota archaeon ADurb.Bin165]
MNLLLIDVPANNSPPNPEKNDDSEDFLTENLT